LIKEGAGTLVLSGSNSYSGGTTVAAGILELANTDALPGGTSLTVGAGGMCIYDPAAFNPALAVTPAGSAPGEAIVAVPECGTLALLIAALCTATTCSLFGRRSAGCGIIRQTPRVAPLHPDGSRPAAPPCEPDAHVSVCY